VDPVHNPYAPGAGTPPAKASAQRGLRALVGFARKLKHADIEVGIDSAARLAIVKPAQAQGVDDAEAAVQAIVRQTRGYPYFLQEWGKHAWDHAAASPIRVQDVTAARLSTMAAPDEGLFRVRFDRLTPAVRRVHEAHRAGRRLAHRVSCGLIWGPRCRLSTPPASSARAPRAA
jgi:hypothetical protein